MLQPCYTHGIDRKPFEVLGVRLAPLTVYHARVLSVIESPFFTGGVVTEKDLTTLALICSLPTKRDVDAFLYGDNERSILEFIAGLGEYDIKSESAKAEEYLDYYRQTPARKSTGKDDGRIFAPWWGMLKSALCERCGYSSEDAWDCILCEAFAEIGWYGARHGDETLMDEYSYELRERYRRGEYKPPSQEELAARMRGES